MVYYLILALFGNIIPLFLAKKKKKAPGLYNCKGIFSAQLSTGQSTGFQEDLDLESDCVVPNHDFSSEVVP